MHVIEPVFFTRMMHRAFLYVASEPARRRIKIRSISEGFRYIDLYGISPFTRLCDQLCYSWFLPFKNQFWFWLVKRTVRFELRQWNLKSKHQGNWANLSFSKEAFTLCDENLDKNFESKGPVKSRIVPHQLLANANDMSSVACMRVSRLEGQHRKRLLNEPNTNVNIIVQMLTECYLHYYQPWWVMISLWTMK